MGNQYQQIPNQNTTPSQRPYIPTNTQLDRRTNRTQLNHKTQQETVPQCTNLESKITNSKMPKKLPTQASKEFSDTYSDSTVMRLLWYLWPWLWRWYKMTVWWLWLWLWRWYTMTMVVAVVYWCSLAHIYDGVPVHAAVVYTVIWHIGYSPFLWLWRYTGQKVAQKMLISKIGFFFNFHSILMFIK
jgi:hypothetical protein